MVASALSLANGVQRRPSVVTKYITKPLQPFSADRSSLFPRQFAAMFVQENVGIQTRLAGTDSPSTLLKSPFFFTPSGALCELLVLVYIPKCTELLPFFPLNKWPVIVGGSM